MITEKQCRVLWKEYARTQNMSVSALKAGVDRKTARKYLNEQRSPLELRQTHDWRTRPDPLPTIWSESEAMLVATPELESKALFEFFLERPEAAADRRAVEDLPAAGSAVAGHARPGDVKEHQSPITQHFAPLRPSQVEQVG
jgi:hypothetical protein